jgi:hypothetical protein
MALPAIRSTAGKAVVAVELTRTRQAATVELAEHRAVVVAAAEAERLLAATAEPEPSAESG